jgi:two-component system, NarL family, sensor kinase
MSTYSKEIFFALIVTVIVFVLLVTLIGVLIFLHSQKMRRLEMEKSIMRSNYEQSILQARLEIQENTFNNISQEIHDNVGQLLSLAKVQLNIIDQTDYLDKAMLQDVKESVGKAMADLRDIAKSMSGERIQQMGLLQTLQHEVERINRSKLLQASLNINGEPCKLNEQKQLIIFRIVQEALQNIIKHAEAKSLEVKLNCLPSAIELLIIDDGKGFDTQINGSETGLGLQNIINRAALIGGEASINSRFNEGTTIKLIVPYE